jgi:putative CocE/NonD family hydrolase
MAVGRAASRERRLLALALRLPPPRYAVSVERDIALTMPDGVVLMADRYWPAIPDPYPTVLIRTPYGRGLEAPGITGRGMMLAARLFAERGYAVIAQTVRGRFDSGGAFDPRVHEPMDGRATMEWIAAQPWFNGALGMWGASYLGFVQWAVAADAPPYLKALVPAFTGARSAPRYHPDGAFALLSTLEWLQVLEGGYFLGEANGGSGRRTWRAFLAEWMADARRRDPRRVTAALAPALLHLPLVESDAVALGKPVPFFQDMLTHRPPDDSYWLARDFSAGIPRVRVPISLVGGWYDLFLRDVLNDYAALRAAGQAPNLTIGPWTHTDLGGILASIREALRWFAIHLQGETSVERAQPVRLFVMGANEWRNVASWPPAARTTRYYLHGDGALSAAEPTPNEPPDHYRYDPADPTPTFGGPVLMPPSGAVDNRPLAARRDVLCYTTAPLAIALDVIGPVRLELYARSSVAYTDFFGRLCDVAPDGRSINVCDGLLRVLPGTGEPQPDGSLRIEVEMWATAQRFRRGHRLRLLVASGAHPRWARNLGTGEPVATGTRMISAEQTIYHDQAHPSALVLPVVRR